MSSNNTTKTIADNWKPSERMAEKYPLFKDYGPPPLDAIGLFTFLRTYSRRHDDDDTNSTIENWDETVARVVTASNEQLSVGFTDDEQKEFFNLVYNLKCCVAGRFLWQLGTGTVDKLGIPSLMNCAFTVIDSPIRPFTWAFEFLMLGCVPKDTPILTNKGIVEIQDVCVGDMVWSFNTETNEKELKRVMRVHDPIVGIDENIKLKCKYGEITCSKKHPILVRRDNEWVYVKAGEVKMGEVLQKFTNADTTKIPIFHKKAWMVGSFLGDGCSNVTGTGGIRVRMTKDNKEMIESFVDGLKDLSSTETDINCKASTRKDYAVDMWMVEKTFTNDDKIINKWDDIMGCSTGKKVYTVCIPEWIKESYDYNLFMSFLVGLIDTDGFIVENKVSISTSSLPMKNDIVKYASLFGLNPWVTVTKMDDYNRSGNGYKMTTDNYTVSFRSRDFKKWVTHFQNSAKRNSLLSEFDRISNLKKQYSRKSIIIPEDLVAEEIAALNLTKTKYHFNKKCKNSGYVGSGYYESRNADYSHLLKYDMVVGIETDLDIPEDWKDLTVEDNSNYYAGNGSFYCTHNSGVGFRILPEDVAKLPKPKKINVTRNDVKDADFIVPDSREGWVRLLKYMLEAHFTPAGKDFSYSCMLVRSKGAAIKTFGGIASGPENLCEGMKNINMIINRRVDTNEKLHPIDCLDIMNIIGSVVKSGNVRRSALLCIGSIDDNEYLMAKRWDLGNIPNWRSCSNNSILCNDINEALDKDLLWEGFNGNGEPYGFINLDLSRKDGRVGEYMPDPGVDGMNPCAEICLHSYNSIVRDGKDGETHNTNNNPNGGGGETCCLGEIFLPNIDSLEELKKCVTYVYRTCKHSLRLKCYNSHETEEIVHKNSRIGIGVTGYLQASEKQKNWLSPTYEYLRKYDEEYSAKHDFPTSIRLTTIKPSGTLSLLGGTTPGIHPGFSQYYIRRVRVASTSPLIPLMRMHNYHIEYARHFDGKDNHETMIISFPYTLSEGTLLTPDITAVDQLEFVKRAQREWSDNSVSVTIYYKKEELPAIKEWLKNNYNDNIKSVSFLLHSDHGFDQAPMEEITKEQYDKMVSEVIPVVSTEGICYHDDSKNFEHCVGGSCPLR